ncbi:MAG: hypothetical protein QOF51_1764 [Chloroflexota bacterium]|nr:hypothetical protein [Chloroflexota bacterium]
MPTLTINGYLHNYEDVGDGIPLVYMAGTRFDSARDKASSMREHAQGFRLIIPDPRGLGGSVHTSEVQPQDWVEDLGALLDALGIAAIHLAAETLGTRIVTRFAATYPERVRSLILNGAIAYSSPTGDEERRRNANPAAIPEDRRQSLEYHQGTDWARVNEFYLAMHGRPEFHEYYDLRTLAPGITTPTLLMRGDVDDPVHPVMHSAELHRLFPRSWLAIFPNTEFNALRGRPDEAWDLIRRFIAEQEASA